MKPGLELRALRGATTASANTGEAIAEAVAELIEELLVDAALFHAEAELRWLEHCEAKLRAPQRSRVN